MIGYYSVKLSPYNTHLPLYGQKYALHRTSRDRPRMVLYGPPTYCRAGHFWHAWYFQMRRPDHVSHKEGMKKYWNKKYIIFRGKEEMFSHDTLNRPTGTRNAIYISPSD